MVTVLCTVDSLIPSLPDFFVPEPVDGGLQGATSLQLDSWSHFRTLSQLVFELNLELSTRLLLTQVLVVVHWVKFGSPHAREFKSGVFLSSPDGVLVC